MKLKTEQMNIAPYLMKIQDMKQNSLIHLLEGDMSDIDLKIFNDKIAEYNKSLDNIRKISSRDIKKFYNA